MYGLSHFLVTIVGRQFICFSIDMCFTGVLPPERRYLSFSPIKFLDISLQLRQTTVA
jgi:hypothetical protein